MRQFDKERVTKETDIKVFVDLDGSGKSELTLEGRFFSHMLTAFTKYSFIDMKISASGDDPHHLIEDTGIVIGEAIKHALGDKKGIKRFGHAYIPMDEALVRVCLDLSGRSFLEFEYDFSSYKTDDYETQNTVEFFRALAFNLGATVHIDVLRGKNDHHVTEAIYKAFGAALKIAVEEDDKIDIMSTKGTIS